MSTHNRYFGAEIKQNLTPIFTRKSGIQGGFLGMDMFA